MPPLRTRIIFLVLLSINLFSIKFCIGFSTTIDNQSINKVQTSTSTKDEWREYCPNCNRPTPSQCLCEHLPTSKIRLQTHVVILQHPVEFRRKTISTVPLIKLCLEHVSVMVGRSFDDNIELQRLLDGGIDNRMPLLLFPGDDAVTLDDDNISDVHQKLAKHFTEDAITSTHSSIQSNSSIKSNNKYLLIIVDGTWKQAKQILRNSPSILRRCQPVQFKSTSQISIYDSIRKQPDSHCLSTLESCERTLTLLEPRSRNMKLASYHLLSALKAMILKQMKYEQRYLENHPELVRNVVKLHAKKIRQEQLMLMDNIIPPNNTHEENNNTEDTVTINISSSVQLPKGYELRQLKAQTNDAKYVDSIWPYSSKKSLGMIEKQIHADNVNSTRYNNNDDGTSSSACCLGIEYKKELVACIIRHRNGSLGILHVEPQHRYLGLAQVLLQTAMDTIASRDEKLFAYILDGNKASERLFSKLGWRKDDPLGKRGTGKRKAKRLWIHPGSRS